MGENKEKENEQKGQGGPNPWIYDVSKVNPGQQYEPQQPSYGLSPMNPMNPYGAPQQARRRGLLILWITLIVLVLLIAVSILILILIVR